MWVINTYHAKHEILLKETTGLFYYEYLITFSREVRLVWKTRYTYVSVLFVLLRYMALLAYVPTLYFATSASDNIEVWGPLKMYLRSLRTLTFFIPAGVSASQEKASTMPIVIRLQVLFVCPFPGRNEHHQSRHYHECVPKPNHGIFIICRTEFLVTHSFSHHTYIRDLLPKPMGSRHDYSSGIDKCGSGGGE